MDLKSGDLDQLFLNQQDVGTMGADAGEDDTILNAAISDFLNDEQFLDDSWGPVKQEFIDNTNAILPLPVTSGSDSDSGSVKQEYASPTSSSASPETRAEPRGASVSNSKKRSADVLDFDSSDVQREKRLQRNRESAALSRWRKKTTMQSLMVKTRELEKMNSKLNYLLSCANMDNQILRAELVRYQSAGTPPPVAAPGESAVGVQRPGAPVYSQVPVYPVPRPDAFPVLSAPTEAFQPVQATLPLPRLPRVSRPTKAV
eukprot:CAMPEP_0197865664 /NCGR_PEP_ID=MMETSP1438-20131217/43790_1 /TAXON_ID=1461541 /ORGANISM="Pterosperma sp., Strain CCMP1384" /LENGTH=258 /DNA_ID=CAMNT_0043484157 /DNA_START=696 /DNA_END=1472 /DNA_ORIENTATION=-